VAYSSQLPAAFRGRFVSGFAGAAKSGFEVGRGQTGAGLHLPAGVPAYVVAYVEQLAHQVFSHAFVAAMRPAMVLPITIVFLAALLTFGVRNQRVARVEGEAKSAAPSEAVA
jgi:hypothetical protein